MATVYLHPHNAMYDQLRYGTTGLEVIHVGEDELMKGELARLFPISIIEEHPPYQLFAHSPEHNPRAYKAPGRTRHKKGKR